MTTVIEVPAGTLCISLAGADLAVSAAPGAGRFVPVVGGGLAGTGVGAGEGVATGRSATRGGGESVVRRPGSGVGLTAGFAELDSLPAAGVGVSRDSTGGATRSGAAWSGGGVAAGGLSVLHPIAKLSIRHSKGNRTRFFMGMTPLYTASQTYFQPLITQPAIGLRSAGDSLRYFAADDRRF
ncbi:MAG TPA: hypothetical protein VFR18_23620 [Terriglobia bacterium]|nr:hypothetical protein [Terriglobia bacterium]